MLQNLQNTRESVLKSSISFEKEIEYYSKINTLLIVSIKNINLNFAILHNDSDIIYYLLQLQESAGLERAHTYNFLLSEKKPEALRYSIKNFIVQREKLEELFLLNASKESIDIYNKFYKKKIAEQVSFCSTNLLNNKIYLLDIEGCFHASTQYIDMFENIYRKILDKYIKTVEILYKNSLYSLYNALAVAIISFLMIILLLYTLFQLINREEKNKLNLQIAAYTFEAQEGVVITDAHGQILRVNNSFRTITGYTAQEAIGHTPKILKSNQHPEGFYKKMWQQLTTKGEWQGEIVNKRKNGELYSEMLSISSIKNDNGEITHYIAQFVDISDMKKAQKALQHQVDHDYLSGLLNRKGLMQRLKEFYSRAKRNHLQYAFFFIDLDNFKSVNDTYGHDIGDKLIVEVSKRLKMALREEDVVARLSGDEFSLIVEIKNTIEVKSIANKILHEISKEMIIDNHYIKISSSIGIKLFPQKNTTFDEIIIHADNAMYQAKKGGKNRFVIYSE